jgi:hypothetical protein
MAFGRDEFHVLHANSPELVGHHVGGLLHVGLMLGRGADAGNTKEIFEFIQESLLIRTSIIHCWGSHRCAFLSDVLCQVEFV